MSFVKVAAMANQSRAVSARGPSLAYAYTRGGPGYRNEGQE